MYFRYLLLAVSLFLVPHVVAQDDLELRVEVLEVEVVEIKGDVDDVETDVSQNTGQIYELVNDVDDIDELNVAQEQRIMVLEEENSLLRVRLNILEQMVNSHDLEIQVLNETVSDLDVDNSTNQRLAVLESDVTVLESDVTSLNTDVTTLEIDVTVLQSNVTVIENDVTEIETTVQELDASTDQRLEDLEEATVDYSNTAFLAAIRDFLYTPPGEVIVFSDAILNRGNNYEPDTGVYTVPVDGIYQFTVHFRNFQDRGSGAWLEVDDEKVAYVVVSDETNVYDMADLVMTLDLNAGQQVWVSPYSMGAIYGTDPLLFIYSWFSGHLIYPL